MQLELLNTNKLRFILPLNCNSILLKISIFIRKIYIFLLTFTDFTSQKILKCVIYKNLHFSQLGIHKGFQ